MHALQMQMGERLAVAKRSARARELALSLSSTASGLGIVAGALTGLGAGWLVALASIGMVATLIGLRVQDAERRAELRYVYGQIAQLIADIDRRLKEPLAIDEMLVTQIWGRVDVLSNARLVLDGFELGPSSRPRWVQEYVP
jgi:hypothetical protein